MLFLCAMPRGMKLLTPPGMLSLRSDSWQQEVRDTEVADIVVGEAEMTEPLLWDTVLSSSSLLLCFSSSSGMANRRLPISGGLLGQSGRQLVAIRGLWMPVVIRTIWSMTPSSWGS